MTFTTKENGNINISSDDSTHFIILDEKEHLEREKNSKTFELFLKGLGSVGVGLSLSVIATVIFALLIAPQRAHAATSSASAHKSPTISAVSSRSQEIEMYGSNHTSIVSPSSGLRSQNLHPNMPRSANEPELHSLQSRFGSGTSLLQKKKINPQNHSVTIRAAGSERSVPIEVEAGQLALPVIKEAQKIKEHKKWLNNFLKKISI